MQQTSEEKLKKKISINFVDCAAAIECTGVVSLAQV